MRTTTEHNEPTTSRSPTPEGTTPQGSHGPGGHNASAKALDDPVGLAADRGALAGLLIDAGHLDEAQQLLDAAGQSSWTTPGDDHHEVAVVDGNLAAVALATDDLTAAERHARAAPGVKERHLGPDHPELAVSLTTLGTIRRRQGDDREAARLLRRALAVFRLSVDPRHPISARSRTPRHSPSDKATTEGDAPMTFDPILYKTTTRQQWEDAAEAWHRWGPTLEAWLGEATVRMLDRAAVTDGSRVLDVASGAGGQTLAAARRAGSTGKVVATDISATILTYATKAAAEAGLTNVETLEADGEHLEGLPTASFDAVISRLGLIYFPDQQRALVGIHRVLRDGARIAAIVYSTADRNQFFSVPVSIIRERAQLPAPLPGQPGPFSLGAPGVLEAALADAGFRDITVDVVPSPLRLPSAAACVQFERESFGALHQMLSGIPEAERSTVWDEIATALGGFETADGFVGPCELLVASGTK